MARGKTIWVYKFENTAIAAGSRYAIPITDTQKFKYGPFNSYTLYNTSAQNINVEYGKSTTKSEFVAAGNGLELDWSEGFNFYDITLYNAGGAQIAAGEIILIIRKIIPVLEAS